MAKVWTSAGRGIRFKEHPSRKHGKRPDRYYTLYYKFKGQVITEGVGWASDGITQTECEKINATLRENRKAGVSPQSYAEMCRNQQEATTAAKEQKEYEESLTLKAIFEGPYLAAQITKTEHSIKSEKHLMKYHIEPFFVNTPLREITPSKMDEFLQFLMQRNSERTKKPFAPSTIRYIVATVRQIWNYALSRGITEIPYPAKRIKIPTIDNRRTRFLTRDEAELLLASLKKRSEATHDIALLSLFCGLRAGEVFKLQWAEVNFQEGFIHVRDRKNKESGTAWLTPRVKAMLEGRFTGQAGHEYVFPTRDGRRPQWVNNIFGKIVEELGLNDGITDKRDKIVFHSLRHTFASWLAQKGVSLHSLAGLMGHKTTIMTQRYAHLSPEGQRLNAMLIDDTPKPTGILQFKQKVG